MDISIFEIAGADRPQAQPVQRNTPDKGGEASFEDVLGEYAALEGSEEAAGAKAEGCGGVQAPDNTNKNAEAPDIDVAWSKGGAGAQETAEDRRAGTGLIILSRAEALPSILTSGGFDPAKAENRGYPADQADAASTAVAGSGRSWASQDSWDGLHVEEESEAEGAGDREEAAEAVNASIPYAYANTLAGAVGPPAAPTVVIFADGPGTVPGGSYFDGSFRQGTGNVTARYAYEGGTHDEVFNAGGVFAEAAVKLMAADDGAALDPGIKTEGMGKRGTAEVPEVESGLAGDGGQTEDHFTTERIIEAALKDYGAGSNPGAADGKAADAVPRDKTPRDTMDEQAAPIKSLAAAINSPETGLSQDMNPGKTPSSDDANAGGVQPPLQSQAARTAGADPAPVKEKTDERTEKVQRGQRAGSVLTAPVEADDADETVEGMESASFTASAEADAVPVSNSGDNFDLQDGLSKKDTVAGDPRGADAPPIGHTAQRSAPVAADAQKAADERIKAGVYEKIDGGVRMSLSSSNKEVRISLSPDHLGSMSIRLKVDEGTVKADIVVENAAVKGILDGDAPRLKEIFSAHGLVLEKYTIEVNGQGGTSTGWGGSGFMGNGGLWESFREASRESRYSGERKGADAAPAAEPGRYEARAKSGSAKGVDLFI